jgi:CubicO group peptidase (beta-lactamase class C family)
MVMTKYGMTDGDGSATAAGTAGSSATGSAVDGLSGAALVTRRGSMVLEASGGMADAAADALCTPRTRFPVSSVAKQFTAAAVMLLVETRSISLGDRLERLLPDCPEHWRAITVHHLLTHTSGLGHWSTIPGFDVTQPVPAEECLQLAAHLPLLSAPGEMWRYSGTGYLLAAGIVERVSGQEYPEFLTARIFAPLGMTETTVGQFLGDTDAESGMKDVARDGYKAGQPATLVPQLAAYPGTGDVWSTVSDLAHYALAVNSGALLTDRSRQLTQYPHTAVSADRAAPEQVLRFESYGYGYYLGTVAGNRAVCHSGDNPGYQSFHAWLPDLDVCIAVLTNEEETDMGHVVRQILPF